MRPTLTLTLTDENGRTRRVQVNAERFSIGRGQDNDLVLRDSGLSRRHALIEDFGGAVIISDCDSQNGTYVNGELVTGGAALKEGDVISIGEACDIRVSFGDSAAAAPPDADDAYPDDGHAEHDYGDAYPDEEYAGDAYAEADDGPYAAEDADAPYAGAEPEWGPDPAAAPARPGWLRWNSVPVVAVATAVLVVLIAVPVAVFVAAGDDEDGVAEEAPAREAGDVMAAPEPAGAATSTTESGPQPGPAAGGPRAELVERSAMQVMRRISSDDSPYAFPTSALDSIAQKVEQYRGSPSLPAALRAVRQRGPELAALARREGLEPELLVYAALAETDGGRSGDPVATARELLPDLSFLRKPFGSALADSSLLMVAAYKMGGRGTAKSHSLLPVLRSAAKRPAKDRNVWALYEKNAISAQTYDYVVAFLALGVIAQAPQQFGVDAEPLAL